MRIGVIGGGVSGLVSAYLLSQDHDVVLFEAEPRLGGHARSTGVTRAGPRFDVDTGFTLFNGDSSPELCRLLRELGVPSEPSELSLGVRCDATGLEYGTSSLNALFSQRRNAVSIGFHAMIRDMKRFRREAREVFRHTGPRLTFGEYVERKRFAPGVADRHIVPMAAALWSVPAISVRSFPAEHVVRGFESNGLLDGRKQARWLTVTGGTRSYVDAIAQALEGRLVLQASVESVRRTDDGVKIKPRGTTTVHVDEVVIACHADEALALLADPSKDETRLLSAFSYSKSEVVLHTDATVLPRSRRAWSSSNVRIREGENELPVISHYLNRLQALDAIEPFCLTLDPPDGMIADHHVIDRWTAYHPTFTADALLAQKAHKRLLRSRHTSFCGAYWGLGFHEDGVRSALSVVRAFR